MTHGLNQDWQLAKFILTFNCYLFIFLLKALILVLPDYSLNILAIYKYQSNIMNDSFELVLIWSHNFCLIHDHALMEHLQLIGLEQQRCLTV